MTSVPDLRRLGRRALPLVVLVVSVAACGGDDGGGGGAAEPQANGTSGTPGAPAGEGSTGAAVPDQPPVDLCDLVPDDVAANALGTAVADVDDAGFTCVKTGGAREVIIRYNEAGLGDATYWEDFRLNGAEPVPEVAADNFYDATLEMMRLRVDSGYVSIQLLPDGSRDELVALAQAASAGLPASG